MVPPLPNKNSKLYFFWLIALATLLLAGLVYFKSDRTKIVKQASHTEKTLKLYWFIPDGLRADPSVFTIFKWAEEGLMPNLKKMMTAGSYGYSIPVFPGHTPTNFATLLTGSTPKVHGIADGPMHIEGYPLKMVSKGGFSSIAKKVPPIWYTLEENGLLSTVLSVPGSTPPEIDLGVTIRGRWGGWGIDFPAVIFHTADDKKLRQYQGLGNRVFNFGSELTRFIKATDPTGWQLTLPQSYSPIREITMQNWGAVIYACIYDTTDDETANYDSVLFSVDKKQELARVPEGNWSNWLPVTLTWEMKNDYNIYTPKRMAWERNLSSVPVKTEMAINVIRLGEPDFFRIRFFYNSLNSHLVKPSYMAEDILRETGPMIDFPDNYPPQLIYYPEDKKTFLEESRRSLAWHKKIVSYVAKNTGTEVIIHDTYTPNQMLTSRWWMGSLDPQSSNYREVDTTYRETLWQEVKSMYQDLDDILGEIMANADEDTYIVFSSDHGIVPLDREVRLNNLFARKGLLKFNINRDTGVYEIDWKNTRAIYLKMDNIYLNPDGLDGNYHRASGKEYEKLRQEVIDLLQDLEDKNGIAPLAKIVKWEDAAEILDLPADRVGDLVVANKPTYGWIEDISADLQVFKKPFKSGYKQAIIPAGVEGMLTPFVIMGPGVKKDYRIPEPIRHIDQYPTIMTLLQQPIPTFVEGKPLEEIMAEQ